MRYARHHVSFGRGFMGPRVLCRLAVLRRVTAGVATLGPVVLQCVGRQFSCRHLGAAGSSPRMRVVPTATTHKVHHEQNGRKVRNHLAGYALVQLFFRPVLESSRRPRPGSRRIGRLAILDSHRYYLRIASFRHSYRIRTSWTIRLSQTLLVDRSNTIRFQPEPLSEEASPETSSSHLRPFSTTLCDAPRSVLDQESCA